MIQNLAARFTLMTLVAAACGPSSQPDAATGSDAGALAEAKSRAQDLANSNQSYQPVRFVSDIEQVRPPRPVRKPQPDVVVREGTDSIPAEPVPLPAASPEEGLQNEAPVEAGAAPRVPSIVPRDAPLPAAVGGSSGNWRGNDPGPDMGTVIGVVLRGGRVDPEQELHTLGDRTRDQRRAPIGRPGAERQHHLCSAPGARKLVVRPARETRAALAGV